MAAGKRALRPERPEPRRRVAPSAGARHRAVKPRYGRIALVAVAGIVTLVAVLGGFGWLPHAHAPSAAAVGRAIGGTTPAPAPKTQPSSPTTSTDLAGTAVAARRTTRDAAGLPADSGSGRRIVFSQSKQRVWLVGAGDKVGRTYLVSGSVTDNLHPGTFAVYSRSRWAVGVDDSGVMQYFVRFAHGPTGAAIGFHTIPTKNGKPLQTKAELGTPRSHGCVRQNTPDAIALWNFAPDGTKVVVTA